MATVVCPSCQERFAVGNAGGARCPECGKMCDVERKKHRRVPPWLWAILIGAPAGLLFSCCGLALLLSPMQPTDSTTRPEYVAGLIRDLHSSKEGERITAARLLGKLGPAAAEAVPDLVEVAVSEQGLVDAPAAAAHDALVRIGQPATPVLIKALKSTDDSRRERALSVLYKIAPATQEAVAAVTPILDAPPPIRYSAAHALVFMAPDSPRVVPVLIEALGYDFGCRALAMAGLEKLGARARPSLPALRQVAAGTMPLQAERDRLSVGEKKIDQEEAGRVIQLIEAAR